MFCVSKIQYFTFSIGRIESQKIFDFTSVGLLLLFITKIRPFMAIPTKFHAASVEEKWYAYWMERKYFASTPDERQPYTIVIPPPNVTGVLHMGHMLNNLYRISSFDVQE